MIKDLIEKFVNEYPKVFPNTTWIVKFDDFGNIVAMMSCEIENRNWAGSFTIASSYLQGMLQRIPIKLPLVELNDMMFGPRSTQWRLTQDAEDHIRNWTLSMWIDLLQKSVVRTVTRTPSS